MINDTMYNNRENAELAVMYLERMAAGIYPSSNSMADTDSDLNSAEVVRCVYFIRDIIKSLIEEAEQNNQIIQKLSELQNDQERLKRSRKMRKSFPLECLERFVYEADKSIMNFVAQLRELAEDPDVKGMNCKIITDWLKQNDYLQEGIDPVTGDRATLITQKGKEDGLYSEERKTRFGQKYIVIMYSENAQKWIVDQMAVILK